MNVRLLLSTFLASALMPSAYAAGSPVVDTVMNTMSAFFQSVFVPSADGAGLGAFFPTFISAMS